jgi:hypothetical protein
MFFFTIPCIFLLTVLYLFAKGANMAYDARFFRALIPAKAGWCLYSFPSPDIWRGLVLFYGKQQHLLSFSHCH